MVIGTTNSNNIFFVKNRKIVRINTIIFDEKNAIVRSHLS